MINKLLTNRIFAVLVCCTFALAFMVAKGQRKNAALQQPQKSSPLTASSSADPQADAQSDSSFQPSNQGANQGAKRLGESYGTELGHDLKHAPISSELQDLMKGRWRTDQTTQTTPSARTAQATPGLTVGVKPQLTNSQGVDDDFLIQPNQTSNDFSGKPANPINERTSGFDPALDSAQSEGPSFGSMIEEPLRFDDTSEFETGSNSFQPNYNANATGLNSNPANASVSDRSGQANSDSRIGDRLANAASDPSATNAKEPKTRTAKEPAKKPKQDSNSLNPTNFKLAAQPKLGESFHEHHPQTDKRSWLVPSEISDFHPGPIYDGMPYYSSDARRVYEGKTLNANQRPLLELGRPWYQLGQLSEGYDFWGKHNPITPQLIVFGDHRTAYASNNNVNDSSSQVAFEWNMNWDLRLTSTERIAWFIAPMNDGNSNTRFELDNDRYVDEWNADFLFGYLEGDLGAIVGGMTGQTLPFDFPFAIGVMPLLFQNGVWLEDQFLGVAATIPARHNRRLNISNMDITFFAGFDEITSAAFDFEDDVGKLYGIASFIEAWNGYWEVDYAYLEDRNSYRDRSYHNIGIGYTRRYGRWISNSTRVIVNAGQSTEGGPNTADGVLLLSENSLITGAPSTIVPYFNFFAGFDRPQKAAGANILRNTGILFESDGMTGYPTLDDTAQNTFGGAVGINMLASDFSQQLVLETAFLGVMGDRAERNAAGDQYGVGLRYQLPLTNSVILRADAMYGFLRGSDDINGARLELRKKF